MHEFGIARDLVETVTAAALRNNATAVTEVILEIGELTFIGKEQLRFAFELLGRESALLSGSKLLINDIPAEVSCRSCGYRGPIERYDEIGSHFITPVFACPNCTGKIDILKGRECTISTIKMMVDDYVQVQ